MYFVYHIVFEYTLKSVCILYIVYYPVCANNISHPGVRNSSCNKYFMYSLCVFDYLLVINAIYS